MSRFLLTGGGGFVGQWLARLLIQRGHDATLAGSGIVETAPTILTAEERAAVQWIVADIREQDDVNAMLDASRPDVVVHLAGIAFQAHGDQDPALAYDVNVLGAVRLFAAINERRAAGTMDPTTLIVGTGLQYGIHPRRRAATDRGRRAAAAHALRGEQDGAGGGCAPGAAVERRTDRLHPQLQPLGRRTGGGVPAAVARRAHARAEARRRATRCRSGMTSSATIFTSPTLPRRISRSPSEAVPVRRTTSVAERGSAFDSWPPMSCFALACRLRFPPHHRSFERLTFRRWLARRRS